MRSSCILSAVVRKKPIFPASTTARDVLHVDREFNKRHWQKYRRSGAAQRHISAWGEGKKREKLRSKRHFLLLISVTSGCPSRPLTTMQVVVREARGFSAELCVKYASVYVSLSARGGGTHTAAGRPGVDPGSGLTRASLDPRDSRGPGTTFIVSPRGFPTPPPPPGFRDADMSSRPKLNPASPIRGVSAQNPLVQGPAVAR